MGKPVIGWLATSGKSFIQPVMQGLSDDFAVRELSQWPEAGIDLLWCDWCDAKLVEITARPKTVPIVARLHSYEAFRESGGFLDAIDWGKVDVLVFTADHVREYVASRHQLDGPKIFTIPLGVDLGRFVPGNRSYGGRKIAWAGDIGFKKGPQLFLQAAAALHSADPEFEFHVAGEMTQERYEAYFEHLVPRLGLQDSLHLHGRIQPQAMPGFFQGMDYVLSTSPWESKQMSVVEAVASGCIPLLHAWPGAESCYPGMEDSIWATTEELLKVVDSRRPRPEDRETLRSVDEEIRELRTVVEGVLSGPQESTTELRLDTGPFWEDCDSPRISAAMIVKDEAANLEQCLLSIREVVDEVVLLDTGSTDETMDIGRRLGTRVFQEPWQADFSLHRNHSIEHCRGDWILVIDGDETLANAGDLREVMESRAAEEDADSVVVRIDTLTDSGEGEHYFAVRAFRKECGHYEYPVHNQLKGVQRPIGSTAVIEASYRGTMEAKAKRSIAMLEKLVDERPEDPHGPFFLCKTYRSMGDARNTLLWAQRLATMVPDSPLYAIHWVWHFHAALALQGPEAAEEVLRQAGERHRGLADLEHCRLALAAHHWVQAVKQPGIYAYTPQASLNFARNLPHAAELLGLPFVTESPARD